MMMVQRQRKLNYRERRELARKDAIPVNVHNFEVDMVDSETVMISWDEKKAHFDYVQVDYSTDLKEWSPIIRLPYQGGEYFIEHEVKPGREYYYRVAVRKITTWTDHLYDAVEIRKDE